MSSAPPFIAPPEQSLLDVVDALKQDWRNGEIPDLQAAIQDHPSLLRERSLLVDLAYEDFCLRESRGEPINVDQFCRTVPAFGSQVREAILGHQYLADHPEFFAAGEPNWPVAGDVVGGVSVLRELGRGTFGRAYLGCDREAGERPVVLKLSAAPTSEARTLGKLQHPNIAGVLWARREPDKFAICMPFLGAATLRDLIDVAFAPGVKSRDGQTILSVAACSDELQAELGEDVRLAISPRDRYPLAVAATAAPLAAGLAYLHGRGITHGDLKPSNVVIGPGGRPSLIDFNLSHTRETALLRCGGTLPYMAPEQIEWLLEPRHKAAPTPAADVFSFGVVLHEALTGKLPQEFVEGPDALASARRLLEARRSTTPSLRRRYPEVPRRLASLVEACLRQDPAARPSAAQLARGLADLHRPWAAKYLAVAACCAVLLVGATLTQFGGVFNSRIVREGAVALPEPTTAEGFFDRGVRHLAAGRNSSALEDFERSSGMKPDGRTYAYLALLHARSAHHREAEGFYREALTRDYGEAWVHNNLAVALAKLDARPGPKLKLALEEVNRARELSRDNRAIEFNWAWIRYLSNVDAERQRLDDPECAKIMEKALQAGPGDLDVYYKAALVFAASSKDDARARALAVDCVRNAIASGKKASQLKDDPILSANLAGDLDFERALLTPESPAKPIQNLQVVNPSE